MPEYRIFLSLIRKTCEKNCLLPARQTLEETARDDRRAIRIGQLNLNLNLQLPTILSVFICKYVILWVDNII